MIVLETIEDLEKVAGGTDLIDLDQEYDNALANDPKRVQETLVRQGYFHPSAVGMCGRRNVYEVIRAPLTTDVLKPQTLEIFELGHSIHALVQKRFHDYLGPWLRSKGLEYEFEDEVPHNPEIDALFLALRVGGTADGLLKIVAPKLWSMRAVLEIKSINDANCGKLKGPKDEHVEQAHLYAYRFNCPLIILWYYNKNNSSRRVYVLRFDHSILEKVLKKYEGWNTHVNEGTLPPREESFFGCGGCSYQEECGPLSMKSLHNKTAAKTARKKGLGKRRGTRG